MRRIRTATALLLVLLSLPLGASADRRLPGSGGRAPLPVRFDDAGVTTSLLIEDLPGGTYDYSESFATLRGSQLLPPPDGRPYGIYTYDWTDQADGRRVPLQSVGVWHEVGGQRIHIPMLLFENVRFSVDDVTNLIGSESMWFDHTWPLLIDMVMPDSRQTPSWTITYPRASNMMRWPRTFYIWYARKSAGAETIWQGVYATQTGGIVEKKSAWHRTEMGPATRAGETTARTPVLFARYETKRRDTGTRDSSIEANYFAGICVSGSDVTLAHVRMTQQRSGEAPFDHPQRYDGWMQVGVDNGRTFVPLLGVHTSQRIRRGSDVANDGKRVPMAKTDRDTTVGVYDNSGSFRPVASYRYHGERRPQDLWIADHLYGGGPGDQRSGDWSITAGTFTGDTFVPLARVTYDDTFAGHHFRYRAIITAGSFALGRYVPVVGSTYDGQVPMLVAASEVDQGDGRYSRWETSTGTFVQDTYRPLAGARFEPGVEGGQRKHRWRVLAGVYQSGYDSFTPVAYASYDGDQAAGRWAGFVQSERLYGLYWDEGEWDIVAGLVVGDDPMPLIDLAYRTSAPDGSQRDGDVSSLVIGVYPPGASEPVPLAAVTLNGRDGLREKGSSFDVEVAAMTPVYLPIACATVTVEPYSVMPRVC